MARCVLALVLVALLGTAVSAALSSSPGATAKDAAPDPKFVQTQINDILSAQEYNRKYDRVSGRTLVEFLAEKLSYVLSQIADALSFGGGVGKKLSAALAWTVIVVFVVLFITAAIRVLRKPRAQSGLTNPGAAMAFDLPSSSKLLADAAKCADAGDYRGAFLQAYMGSIAYLDEVNVLRFERSRTNWEYLRDLNHQGREPLAHELQPLTMDFDRKLYGHDSCSRSDYDRAVATYEQVRQMAA